MPYTCSCFVYNYGQLRPNVRLNTKVEMWMYEQLQQLYTTEEESKSNYVELDLDEVLDIEDVIQRKRFIRVSSNSKSKSPCKKGFI